MSSIYDQLARDTGTLIDAQYQQKKADLATSALEKKERLDPLTEFNPDLWDVIDNDTLVHKTQKTLDGRAVTMRLALPDDEGYDAWETRKENIPVGERGHDPYADDPKRAFYHRQSYAKQFGKDIQDVSNEDLYNAGLAQKQRLIDGMEALRGKKYDEVSGEDKYGRLLGRFVDRDAFDQISGGAHAGYTSPFSAVQRFRDSAASEFVKPEDRGFVESIVQDGAAGVFNFTASGLNAIAHFGAIGVIHRAGGTVPKALNEFFTNNQDRIKNVTEFMSTNDKNFRERMDAKEKQFLEEPLYNARAAQYAKDDPSLADWQVAALATKDEYIDRLEYLYENPGRILDASIESIPYMLGIGVAGRAGAKLAAASVGRGMKGTLVKAGVANPRAAELVAAQYVASRAGQKAITRASKGTGILAIAGTEASMNAAEVYGQIRNMTEEELSGSEKYQALRKRGISHEKAAGLMAKKGFDTTLYSNFVIAGFAAMVTGAGNWESQLLRKFSDGTKRGITRRMAEAGTREFFEESIQSGGGELVSQIGLEEATGKKPGPGVGAATAEGGLTGLAAGAGLASVQPTLRGIAKGAQKIADIAEEGKRDKVLSEAEVDVQVRAEPGGPVGGDTKAAEKRVKSIDVRDSNGKIDRKASGTNALALVLETLDKEGSVRVAEELKIYYSKFKQYSAEFPDGLQDQVSQKVEHYIEEFKLEVQREATELQEKLRKKEITEADILEDPAMLEVMEKAASLAQFSLEDETTPLGEFLSSARDVTIAVEKAKKTAAQDITSVTPLQKTTKPITEVLEEKMGYGRNDKGQLGIEGHKQAHLDAVAAKDRTSPVTIRGSGS
jgi:hypothetical protein